jgi:hypothetical protein
MLKLWPYFTKTVGITEENIRVLEMGTILDALRNRKCGKNLRLGRGKNMQKVTMTQ